MIRYVVRKELDEERYNQCVSSSSQKRVYGYSWFLDVVSDQWSALILNDYEAVMPLPWNSKLGLKYITQPFFCQHLGIYASKKPNDSLVREFFDSIPKQFLKTDLSTNVAIDSEKFNIQTNYELNLDKTYDLLLQGYRKDRRKSLRKSTESNLKYQDFDNKSELIALYRQVFDYVDLPEKYYATIDRLIDSCMKKKVGFMRNVFYADQLVCSGFFIRYEERIYYMFGASNNEGKKYGATTYLIDSVIQEFAHSETVFDFEGSNIKSIASFYKSFGSEKTSYYKYSSNVIKGTVF